VTRNTRYIEAAKTSLRAALSSLYEAEEGHIGKAEFHVGAFNGISGVLYTLNHLSSQMDVNEVGAHRLRLQTLLEQRLATAAEFDIVAGISGYASVIYGKRQGKPSCQAG